MNNKIIIYKKDDSENVSVRVEDETVWLTQKDIANLFGTTPQNITIHLKNCYMEGELNEEGTCKEFLQVQMEGVREIKRNRNFYNLDAIISVGYRVNSVKATQFRIWATQKLKEFLVKGFVMDDEKLKNGAGGNYWKELLERIRDIRSSEKVLYRQVLDLYATSIDYNPKSEESIIFFKIVQNKLHYMVNQNTASETIYSRADSEKEFMGLTNFKGDLPAKSEVLVAKNYLDKDELFRLNRLVSAFFDLAEIKAKEHIKMHMKDWVTELDKFSEVYGKGTLKDSGSVSQKKAFEKAEDEYMKYQVKTLSPVEKSYLENLKKVEKEIKVKVKDNE
ncbi:MAG: virulence RhuM family protein [Nanoarchaeota archaeon]|jgi:hypothetical protein|nr:virulence RhuM family protein [Nanoarchaeota archaeon]